VSQESAEMCESERSEIEVIVSENPLAPTVSDITYCVEDPVVALTATADGSNTLNS